MKTGFACAWKKVPEETWSRTPWDLRNALRRQTCVTDLGIEYSEMWTLLKGLYVRRRRGRWMTTYHWSSTWDRIVQKRLQSSLRKTALDAVIEIGDLAQLDVSFYVYQDLNFQIIEEYYDPILGGPGNFRGIDLGTIRRRQERENRIYESATRIFAMSEWFADTLVQRSGVPREKVTVVYAGLDPAGAPADEGEAAKPRGFGHEPEKLLFVGRDFFRKGGDIVLKALGQLRREYSSGVRLTLAGPDRWPLSGDIPAGVTFLGRCSPTEVARLYRDHDVLVMPSRFEGFGKVVLEALANGVPVIGRASFAMPEFIVPGQNGALVSSDDPAELASAIVAVLGNPSIRGSTVSAARAVRTRFSWDAVAGRMLTSMWASA
jgi:glycosyltransferase involved in cell wall biosynthesis